MRHHQICARLGQLDECCGQQFFFGLNTIDVSGLHAKLGAGAFQAAPAGFHETAVVNLTREKGADMERLGSRRQVRAGGNEGRSAQACSTQ